MEHPSIVQDCMKPRTGSQFQNLDQRIQPGSDPSRPEPAGAAPALVCKRSLGQFCARYGRKYHLGNSHSALDYEFLCSQIDEQYHDLAAIIAVDRAGRIQAGDAMLEGEARSGTYLRLVSIGDFEDQTRWNQKALPWSQLQRLALGAGGAQIHSGRAACLVGRQVERLAMWQPYYVYPDVRAAHVISRNPAPQDCGIPNGRLAG